MVSADRAPLPWGIYVRISVDKGERGDDDYVSLETQEAGCRELIAEAGSTLDKRHVYREVHTGVELFERPVLNAVREAIRRREIGAVAVYQPKRLSREPDHGAYLRTEASQYGAVYRFRLDDHGDSESGALLNYLEQWTGKREHKDITERTMRARVALVKGGRAWTGSRAPYGMRWTFRTITRPSGQTVTKRDRWEADPETAPVVRQLFRDALRGTSMREMARMLNEQHVPPPLRGKGWYQTSVRLILRNRVYTGDAASLRTVKNEQDEYTTRKGHKKYRRTVKDESEWVKLPDGYAPVLVDRETFEAVQLILDGHKSRAGRKTKYPELTLFAGGRATCAGCGSSLSPRMPHARTPQLYCYRRDLHPDTRRPAIVCHILDDAAKTVIRLICERPEIVREQAERHCQTDPVAADLAMVEARLRDIARQQQALTGVAAKITDPDGAAPIALQLDVLAGQKRKAQEDRKTLLDRRAGWEAAQLFLDDITATVEKIKSRLNRFTHAQWQQAVDAFGITATAWPDGADERFTLHVGLTPSLTRHLPELVLDYPASSLLEEKTSAQLDSTCSRPP
jgi:DNA invertase Pin-like site-specific DNA recombinase